MKFTEVQKDTFLLFIASFGNVLNFIWPVLYPYHASYIKHYHPTLTLKYLFMTTLAVLIGMTFGNIICVPFYKIFGLKFSLQLNAVFNLVNSLLFFLLPSFFGCILTYFLVGVIFQHFMNTLTFFMVTKYSKGKYYAIYACTGQSLASLVWAYFSYMINPRNSKMVTEISQNSQNSYFLMEDITNFPIFMIIHGIISVIVIVIPCHYLKNPENYPNNTIKSLKALFKGNKESKQQNEIKSFEIDQQINLSINQVILSQSQYLNENDLKEIELIEGNLQNDLQTEKDYKEISRSLIYLGFVVLTASKNAAAYFMIDNYKYLSLLLVKNDKLSALAFSISGFSNIFGRLIASYIWKKCGFFYSYLIGFSMDITMLITFLTFSSTYPKIILLIVNYARFLSGMQMMFLFIVNYTLYNNELALRLNNLLSVQGFIAYGYTLVIFYIFFTEKNIFKMFYIFLLVDIICVTIFIKYYNNFAKKNKQLTQLINLEQQAIQQERLKLNQLNQNRNYSETILTSIQSHELQIHKKNRQNAKMIFYKCQNKNKRKFNKKELQQVKQSRIAENELNRKKPYTFAVVVDLSEPFKVLDDQLYTTKLKIIDETFNYSTEIHNKDIKFQKYAYVYIYSEQIVNSPRILHVGDIIRLRRFQFVVNGMGELAGHMNHFSNWLIYNVQANTQEIVSAKDIKPNEDREMTNYEKQRFGELQKWTYEFFGNRSIRSIMWWSKMIEPNDENVARKDGLEKKNVDLILKTERVDVVDNRVDFVDYRNIRYILCLKQPPVLQVGSIIKLRNVTLKFDVEGRYITLSSSSSCLIVPENYFDAKLFDQKFYKENYNKITYDSPTRIRKSDDYKTRRDVIKKYPFIENYYFEELLIGKKELIQRPPVKKISCSQATLIDKTYFNRIPIYLKNIKTLDLTSLEEALFQKMVFNVFINDIQDADPHKTLFKFCQQCNSVMNLWSNDSFECCGEIMNICLILKMEVQDESMKSNETFPIYIVTRKQENDPFLLWNTLPDMNQYNKWSNMTKSDFKDFRTKLNALKNFTDKMKIVVELKKTKSNKHFYELCNTLFTPQYIHDHWKYNNRKGQHNNLILTETKQDQISQLFNLLWKSNLQANHDTFHDNNNKTPNKYL